MAASGYTRIPGSAALATRRRGASAVEPVLSAGRSSLARVEVNLDGRALSVGRAVVRGAAVPLLLDVVDRVAPLLEPEEFAVYLHLYRLAVADEKNVCRASRSELTRRTRLHDRRLGKAIAGLVDKGHIVLVDRDRDGTLYRVLLPEESLDGGTLLPAAAAREEAPAATSTVSGPPPAKARGPTAPVSPPSRRSDDGRQADAADTGTTGDSVSASPAPSTSRADPGVGQTARVTRAEAGPRSVGDVCAWFAATHGGGPGRAGGDVAAIVLELLEDGHTFARIPGLLDMFVAKSPRTTPLRDLPRVLGLSS